MTERKLMMVKISINNPKDDWIVGRVNGMIDAIANDGKSFLDGWGYAISKRSVYNVDGPIDSIHDEYLMQADVSRDEFDKIQLMLDRGYGDKRLFDYTVECDW